MTYTHSAKSFTKKFLLTSTALAAVGTVALLPSKARAGDPNGVGANDVWQVGSYNNGRTATETSNGVGHVMFTADNNGVISGNLIQEDIGVDGHVQIVADRAAFYGVESGAMQILGRLDATGTLTLIDTNGVFFGQNSIVDVGGLLATTGNFDENKFFSGEEFDITDLGDGVIENHGMISVADAGIAAFVAPTVKNSGIINAKLGKVAFAAGEKVTIDMYGDRLVEIEVDDQLQDALLENTGQINAEGGTVIMTAQAAKDVVDNVINMEGVINVSSVTQQGGKIILGGGSQGKVNVAGTLDAQGTTGGDIEVTGQFVSAEDGAVLDASGTNGGGTVHFGGEMQGGGDTPTSDYAYVDRNAILRANAKEEGDGGEVIVWSDKATVANGDLEAKGGANSGNGGFVEVSSLEAFDFNGTVDTTAANGEKGTFLLDPRDIEIRGGTGDSPDNGGVAAGGNTALGDLSSGIVEFANNYGLGGGTFIMYASEIEGQSAFTNIDIQARRNITTVAGGDNSVDLADDSNLTIQTQNGAFNTGSINLTNLAFNTGGTGSITVIGSNGGGNEGDISVGDLSSENGDINVSTDNGSVLSLGTIEVTGTGNVSLSAEDDVQVFGTGITTNGGDVALTAGSDGGNDDILVESIINTNGGDFVADAGDDVRMSFTFSGAQVNTAGGDATIITRGAHSSGSVFSMGADSVIDTTTSGDVEGDVSVTADQVDLDTVSAGKRIIAQDGTSTPPEGNVSFNRVTAGDISLGAATGGLELSQDEIAKIDAETLSIGGTNTSKINVDGVDTTTNTIFGLVTLTTGSNLSFDQDNVTFAGTNKFNALEVNSNDSIILEDNARIDTVTGDATFNGDSNDGSVGDFTMGENALLVTNGNNVTVDSLDFLMEDFAEIHTMGGNVDITTSDDFAFLGSLGLVTLEENAFIDADGGNILIQNDGVFSSADADTLRTHTTGTIEVNQWVGGSIQNVIDAVENTGTGTNTVNIGDGTFNEALSIYEDNFILNGDGTTNTTIIDGTGIGGTGISVSANNTVLNGMIVENWNRAISLETAGSYMGLKLNDIAAQNSVTGLFVADDVSLDGLDVDDSHFDSNTFGWYFSKNNPTFPNATTVTNVTADDTTFDGNLRKGIYVEKLDNATFTNIDVIGSGVDAAYGFNAGIDINLKNGDYENIAFNGLDVRGSGVNGVGRGSAVIIKARNDGASYSPFPASLSNVTITDANIVAAGDVGLAFGNNIDGGSVDDSSITGPEAVSIYGGATNITVGGPIGNTISSVGQGVSGLGLNFGVGIFGSDGNTVTNNDIDSDNIGVWLVGSNDTVVGGTTAPEGNDIDSVSHGVATVGLDSGTTLIGFNEITSTAGAGVYLGSASPSLSGGVTVDIDDNMIETAGDGIVVEDEITEASTLNIERNEIDVPGVGINFLADINDGSTVNIIDNTIGTDGDEVLNGILFDHIADAQVNITGGSIRSGGGTGSIDGDGINFTKGLSTGADVNITTVDISSLGDEAIDVHAAIASGATFDISGGSYVGGNNGVEFSGAIDGSVGIDGATIEGKGADKRGINFLGAIRGIVEVSGSTITGGDDGIGSNNNQNNIVDGGSFSVVTSTVTGTNGDGIELGAISNSAFVTISDNLGISGGDNGIHFVDGINGSTVTISMNDSIVGESGSGILFAGASPSIENGATVEVSGNTEIIGETHGINVTDEITGTDTELLVKLNDLIKGNTEDGINIDGLVADNANVNISENLIEGDENGVSFAGIDGATATIAENTIDADDNVGILFGAGSPSLANGALVDVIRNTITASDDGIQVADEISGASVLQINSNTITAGSEGIDFMKAISGASRVTLGNYWGGGFQNNSITADDSGVVFRGDIVDSTVHASGYDIDANDGDAVRFEGEINNSNVTFGAAVSRILASGTPWSSASGGTATGSNSGFVFEENVTGNSRVNIGGTTITGEDGDGVRFEKEVNGGTIVRLARNTIDGQDGQGVLFEGHVDGGTVNIDSGAIGAVVAGIGSISLTAPGGNTIQGSENGVVFNGVVGGSAVNIEDNTLIEGLDGDGILFDEGSPSVEDSTVTIADNASIVGSENGIRFEDTVTGNSLINITGNNDITGLDGDGILFEDDVDNAIDPGSNEQEIYIANNSQIEGSENGIRFAGNVSNGRHDTRIENNEIIGLGGDGIVYEGEVNDAHVRIINTNTIKGSTDGVAFRGDVLNSARIDINNNTLIEGQGGDGVEFDKDIQGGSLVNINNNESIIGDDNGIEMEGIVGGSTVNINGNNDGIEADNNGIIFNAALDDATLNIHDNIINANLDGGVVGSGIYFGGTINKADVNIGNGSRGTNPSNYITVGPVGSAATDGIHFAENVGAGADVNIKGNRIGYTGTPGGSNAGQAEGDLFGDGIEFAKEVNGNAIVDIGDNWINADGNANGSDGDGVKFTGHIADTANVLVGGSGDGNIINAVDNGVETHGIIGATVNILYNSITSIGSGVRFAAGSPSIESGATVEVSHNTINTDNDGIVVVDDITGAGTTLTIKNNTITADDEGVDIDSVNSGAVVNVGGPGATDGNTIVAGGNGIEFDAGIDSTVLIQKNRISAGFDGINIRDSDPGHVTGVDSGALVNILENNIGSIGSDTIGDDGIDFDDSITGNSTVNISGNTIGRSDNKVGDDGIDIDSITGGATVNITNNPNIHAEDNGIEVSGVVNGGANLTISGNNDGIFADNHGIYFGSAINGDAVLNIHDNIIQANLDEGVVGSGIFFNGIITDATVNIGDGTLNGAPSNIIFVDSDGGDVSNLDGIHFDKEVGTGAKILIDGNRIGYTADTLAGPLTEAAIADDAVEFKGPITGDANIEITDNHMNAEDDGVQFSGTVGGTANIVIGQTPTDADGNIIKSGDNGISFLDAITDEALIRITRNDIDAGGNGILFTGNTSNAVDGNNKEIWIDRNSISGDLFGILFEGLASGKDHNIRVNKNSLIEGLSEDGVAHTGSILGANIRVANNTTIYGYENGVRIEGSFSEDDGTNARVTIFSNDDIEGENEHGIAVIGTEYDDVTINISENGAAYEGGEGVVTGGKDGIHIENFEDAWISYNDVRNTGDDGIEAVNGEYVSIYGNYIFKAGYKFNGDEYGADGIHVRNVSGNDILLPFGSGFGFSPSSADVNIYENEVAFTVDDGVEVIGPEPVELYDYYYGGYYSSYSGSAYVYDNDIGHVGYNMYDLGHIDANGIVIKDVDVSEVYDNRISSTWDDGIEVKNGSYTGIFANKLLMIGDEGIQVSNISGGRGLLPMFLIGGGYGNEGWSVEIEGNEIAMTGDHGIWVKDSGRTRIIDNDIFMTGMGDVIRNEVNDVMALFDFTAGPPAFALLVEDYPLDEEYYEEDYFSNYWGDGDGIFVQDVYAPEGFNPWLLTASATEGGSYDGGEGYLPARNWTVLIQGNNVSHTGGDGIEVRDAGSTLIGGYDPDADPETANPLSNNVEQAGIYWTEILGAESFKELVEEGPFEGEGRRTLWQTEESQPNIVALMKDYVEFGDIEHDTHDGIKVSGVYSDDFGPFKFGPGNAGNAGGGDYFGGYAVEIIDNYVNTTGDDGIDVSNSGSVLIDGNTVMNAGYGGYYGYGSVDYYGGDGIVVMDVYGDRRFGPRKVSLLTDGYYGGEGFEDYAVVIRNNDVDYTQDDGIEVAYAGRTLIDNNTVDYAGVGEGGYYGGADGYGADGIHTREIYDNRYVTEYSESYDEETDTYTETYTYTRGERDAVDIRNNIINKTGDDGIEVLRSGRTVIDNNDITHVGYGDDYYYGASDGWGADGIHVRDVIADKYVETETYVYGYYGYYGSETDTRQTALIGDEGYYGLIDDFYSEEYFFNDGTSVTITDNYVDTTADDGIQVLDSGNSVIDNNEVYNVGLGESGEGEGYYDGNEADGIHVRTGFVDRYSERTRSLKISDYYDPEYFLSTSTEVTNNIVRDIDDDGINIENVTDVLVANNDVDNTGDEGIEVVGLAGFFEEGSEGIEFDSEVILVGVEETTPPFWTVDIDNNTVDNVAETGIKVENYDEIDVTNNVVTNFGDYGLNVKGENNGNVEVSGNTFNSPVLPDLEEVAGGPVLANFESGLIDLTGPSNFFNGGAVAMRFDGPLVDLVDDDGPDGFEGTIGEQFFRDQSDYFVELVNGALFDPGQPSVYNALNSSYFFGGDFFRPADTGGAVTAEQFAFLEDKFQHFPDLDTLGLFFFGFVPEDGAPTNFEDFFNEFGQFVGTNTGVNVTITALPFVSLDQSAAFLNQLSPNAGDTDGDGELSAEEAAAIDPAAGGEEVTCWGDAVSSAGQGTTVTYNFDTSFENALADTAACGATNQ